LVSTHIAGRDAEVIVQDGDDTIGRWRQPTLVIGAGKAAARMAAGCEQVLGAGNVRGEVVVADGCTVELASIRVTEAGHPLPDPRGEAAAHRLLALVQQASGGGILCLISGGASSLLACPRPPVSLVDKIRTTQLLLECGADISELNTVRKHLSLIKGGGLLRHARPPMVALVISDVVGDDPGTIGSGPAAPDATSFAQALAVLEGYSLMDRVPPAVAQMLRMGVEGRIPETVKPGDPGASRCRNLVVGSNRTALDGAAREARAAGWKVHIEDAPLVGDTTAAARRFSARLRALRQGRQGGAPLCVLAGGETTVRVQGRGRGGRNQEFALALASEIAGEDVVVLSAGTDGVDGPTDAAGAFVDGTTLRRATGLQLDANAALADNDSYTFFARLGDLLKCGPTGTNVMDIKIVLMPPLSGSGGDPVIGTTM
jgi:hydroxypyruvate reductase